MKADANSEMGELTTGIDKGAMSRVLLESGSLGPKRGLFHKLSIRKIKETGISHCLLCFLASVSME